MTLVSLTFLGAVGTVTGSKYLLTTLDAPDAGFDSADFGDATGDSGGEGGVG